MSITSFFSRTVLSALLAGSFIAQANAQPANFSEHAQLAMMIRQLDMLERIAAEGQTLSFNQTGRYHFDYPRLHTDMQRIRTGIRDYLTPQRAQPRDPVEITGDYIKERSLSGEKGQP